MMAGHSSDSAAPRFAHCCALAASLLLVTTGTLAATGYPSPHLFREHGATQLIVDGKPFLVLGGELENSSASDRTYMTSVWPKLVAMNFNTVLAPAYWELIEPKQNRFDFRSVDALIDGARKHDLRLILLWFGSWKNSMSSYAPAWIKRDQERFPRATRSDGTGLEILSAFDQKNMDADCRAFAALMMHLRQTDGRRQTVIMIQVENEVGMIPDARDHSAPANAAFTAPVPAQLTNYLSSHLSALAPALKNSWEAHGSKSGANWEETFGPGPATDELFSAWTEALYTNTVAAAGKSAYALPMFANAALIRPGKAPGQYPSGGPLPHLFDVWRAAAPSLDFLSPDLYFPNFVEWATKYHHPGNPFFIPETGRVSASEMAANAFWAFGQLNAIGFSPYAPEFLGDEEKKVLAGAYDVLRQMSRLIVASQGTGRMLAVRPPTGFDGTVDLAPQKFTLGDYTFDAHFKLPPPISTGAREEVEMPGSHGGMIVMTAPDEFVIAGTGMTIYFGTHDGSDRMAGIESIDEGRFVNGQWVPGRRMNGDESNQGRQLNVPAGRFTIHRVRLYRYR
jgi:beta-galactosidase GanA